jgi:hypothetical protein
VNNNDQCFKKLTFVSPFLSSGIVSAEPQWKGVSFDTEMAFYCLKSLVKTMHFSARL